MSEIYLKPLGITIAYVTLLIVHFINMESDMEISDYELEMESSMDRSVSDFYVS